MDDLNYAEVEWRFGYHPADSEDRQIAHANCRMKYINFAAQLARDLPAGREKSIVMTKLEEAMFWSNAAIARQKED